MNQPEKLQVSDKHQPSQKNPVMQAYQFECHVDTSRTITVELPVDAPVGLAQIIVLFPDAPCIRQTKHRALANPILISPTKARPPTPESTNPPCPQPTRHLI
ncbi:MAG: hypothetical protein PHH58_05695 [Rhodoferax sp.]|nr:hypothetical protein [Rhodoferax sp.]